MIIDPTTIIRELQQKLEQEALKNAELKKKNEALQGVNQIDPGDHAVRIARNIKKIQNFKKINKQKKHNIKKLQQIIDDNNMSISELNKKNEILHKEMEQYIQYNHDEMEERNYGEEKMDLK